MFYASVSPNIWIIDDGTLDTVVRFYNGKNTETHRYDTEYRQSFPDDDQFLRAVYEELSVLTSESGIIRAAYSCPDFFVPESGDLITRIIVRASGIGDRDRGFLAQLMDPAILSLSPVTSPGFFFFEQLFWKNFKPLFLKDK